MAEGRPPRTQACDLVRIETTSGGQDDRFPLFRTGSGKSVTIKESSLRKAAAVLEGNGINKGDKITLDVGAKDEVFPMFSTGSGKLVTVKESSIRKAAAIFIGENMEKGSHLTNGQLQKTLEHKLDSSDYGQSPVKFQTAGGRFITPLKGSTSLLATGKMNGRSSKPSTTESSCCGRISTRYPFQLKRKNLKDFFGGPPTCQDLMVKCCITQSGSLPHEVSNMDADNAVTYRFYDASHHDEIGLEAFQKLCLMNWILPMAFFITLLLPQDADMCFSLDFPNGHLKTTGPVDSFRPKANSQNDDKELGVEESFCASTLCSGCNQTQATHSEINAAQQLIQAEQSILLNTSGDKEWVQSGDIDVLPNTAEHQQSFPAWTLFMTYLILVEPLNREEIGLPKGLEDINTKSQSQNVQKLKQRIYEGRPTSENDEDDDAHKPCRKLRKRG
ncbi:BRCA2, helical [Musa troglodytarum]|uniref:BRCA2, helical n=1 Tax=Musa troglodytarum TaxID=320322 RepID=A0A9E7ESV5_9LILI|nr:BRCA2, helical [Musa troglodytarum]